MTLFKKKTDWQNKNEIKWSSGQMTKQPNDQIKNRLNVKMIKQSNDQITKQPKWLGKKRPSDQMKIGSIDQVTKWLINQVKKRLRD